jgi:hypothetical protein
VGTSSAVAKVKNLLVGLPPTDAEVAAVQKDPATLQTLVRQWMTLPQYSSKMLSFFVNAFQQDQFQIADLTFQFRGAIPFNTATDGPRMMQDLQESFARTAMEIVARGEPFTSTLTTRRFMMTPALMAVYAVLDRVQVDDHYNAIDLFQRDSPTRVTLESSRPIPIERSIDPGNPDFMTFYEPAMAMAMAPGCPQGILTYPSPAPMSVLIDELFNHHPSVNGAAGDCFPPSVKTFATTFTPADFTTWKMVSIRPPASGEQTARFFDLPLLRSTHELVLNVPRISFFSTPAFNARWQTNDSNQARVLLNQTLIVALGKPIDTTNRTQPKTPWRHVDKNLQNPTVCHECHVALDPMRQFFRQTYSLYGSRQDDSVEASTPGEFVFHDVEAHGSGVGDLAALLANHPLFATAWTQRLCTYAASQTCDESDPEFLRLVELFKTSHYDWRALVEAVFSSPLVSGLQKTKTTEQEGQSFPVVRQEHLCAMLSNRLGIPDVCGLDPNQPVFSKRVRTLAASWPSGQYSRGSASPALPVAPSVLTRGGMESLCVELSHRLVDTERRSFPFRFLFADGKPSPFSSSDSDAAIHALVTNLMGLTSDRAAGPTSILQEHFAAARQSGSSATDALKSTFVLACLSPYVAGMGQ